MTERPGPAPVWQQIREALAAEIGGGRYRPGDRLPAEAALARRFGVHRHTLRRAMAALAASGLVHVRRGTPATVVGRPLDYAIGARTRFRDNLAAAGLAARTEILRIETLRAGPAEAEALGLPPEGRVHVLEAVGLAEGLPVTYGVSAVPADRFPDFPAGMRAAGSVTRALALAGLPDYGRRWTRLSAEAAGGAVARHLRAAEGAPLLCATWLNDDAAGRPVEFGRTWFPPDRVQLVVDRDRFREGLRLAPAGT